MRARTKRSTWRSSCPAFHTNLASTECWMAELSMLAAKSLRNRVTSYFGGRQRTPKPRCSSNHCGVFRSRSHTPKPKRYSLKTRSLKSIAHALIFCYGTTRVIRTSMSPQSRSFRDLRFTAAHGDGADAISVHMQALARPERRSISYRSCFKSDSVRTPFSKTVPARVYSTKSAAVLRRV